MGALFAAIINHLLHHAFTKPDAFNIAANRNGKLCFGIIEVALNMNNAEYFIAPAFSTNHRNKSHFSLVINLSETRHLLVGKLRQLTKITFITILFTQCLIEGLMHGFILRADWTQEYRAAVA